MSTTTDELCEQVALGCRVLGKTGQNDLTLGHISARDPDGRGVWLKGSGFGLEESLAANVVLTTEAGEVLEGTGRRHAEYPIHTEVMKARPDVNFVVHTHPIFSVAFAALGVPLVAVGHDGAELVPPDVPRFTATSGLILTPELGRLVAETLGGLPALFLVNHGIVTVGPDLETAVMRAYYLEKAAQTQLLAMSAGELRHWSSDDEAAEKRSGWLAVTKGQMFEYLVRSNGLAE
jgi:ribulose-5-phosphate 4-epimerase/fuculose-1-phosphate aldolase